MRYVDVKVLKGNWKGKVGIKNISEIFDTKPAFKNKEINIVMVAQETSFSETWIELNENDTFPPLCMLVWSAQIDDIEMSETKTWSDRFISNKQKTILLNITFS